MCEKLSMPCWEIIFYEHTQPRDHERGARLLSLPLIIRTLEGSSVMLNGASSGVGALYHGALRILIIKVKRTWSMYNGVTSPAS